MGRIVLVTGGARSGKSRFAEDYLQDEEKVLYVATAMAIDDEMKERISRHREQRNRQWKTVEAYKDLSVALSGDLGSVRAILFDCVTIMISNLMVIDFPLDWDSADAEAIDGAAGGISGEVDSLISLARDFGGTTVIVTNEVGMGIVPETPMGRHYRDIAGRENQRLARASDEAYLLVSGVPIKLKG